MEKIGFNTLNYKFHIKRSTIWKGSCTLDRWIILNKEGSLHLTVCLLGFSFLPWYTAGLIKTFIPTIFASLEFLNETGNIPSAEKLTKLWMQALYILMKVWQITLLLSAVGSSDTRENNHQKKKVEERGIKVIWHLPETKHATDIRRYQ